MRGEAWADTFDNILLIEGAVALTDDPVTSGIEERLGWLHQVYDMSLETKDFPPDYPVGDFRGLFRKRFGQ